MNHKERTELKKQAQAKLVEARNLIKEAGELAKQGQFALQFGEIGTFIPKRYADPELYRDDALEGLMRTGRRDQYVPGVGYSYTPYDQLSDDEKATCLQEMIDGMVEDGEVPWEFREYGNGEGTDSWWHPSRC